MDCNRTQQGSIIRINKCFHKQIILSDDKAVGKYLEISAFIECVVLLLLMDREKKTVYNDEITLLIDCKNSSGIVPLKIILSFSRFLEVVASFEIHVPCT